MDKKMMLLLPGATIKTLTLEDYPTFVAFEEMSVFKKGDIPLDHAPPHWTKKEFKDYLNRGEVVRGVFKADELVAVYIYYPKQDELYITEIVVHPKIRNHGVGKYLLKLLENEAIRRGLNRCSLTVDPFNGKAIFIYLQSGYQITSYKKGYFGTAYPNTHRFWMGKSFIRQNVLENEEIQIRVNDKCALEKAIRQGFVGVGMVRSKDLDNKLNLIVFKK